MEKAFGFALPKSESAYGKQNERDYLELKLEPVIALATGLSLPRRRCPSPAVNFRWTCSA